MTAVITHSTVTGAPADSTALVDGVAWDANHTITGEVAPSQGGTGVANNDSSTLTISGSFGTTFTVTATTSLTLPTTGTLATLAGTETFINKTLTNPIITGATLGAATINISGKITPSQITADQDNYAPTGLSTATVIRISSDAARNITGLSAGTDGDIKIVENVGSFSITLKDESASSTAANRFALTSDQILSPDSVVILKYDGTSARWRAAGGGGSTFLDSLFTLQDDGDTTKQAQFQLSGITTATTRTYTLPDVSDTLVTLGATQELDSKTLDSSVAKGTWTASGTWTIPAVTLGGTVSGGGNQINNVIIGNSTPLAGSFTSLAYSTTLTGTSTNASALAIGRQGATDPVLKVNAATSSVATGIEITGAAAAGGVNVAAISSGTNENLTVNAKGSGTITLGNTSTGAITLTRATTMSAALTYGGVTLSNAVTGTGNMVLATAPTISTITLSGGQIGFPASQSASSDANTLDDYEEGTWTPAITCTTPGNLSVTYSIQSGFYTKVGRMVFAHYDVTTSAFTHTTASGTFIISGLPFSATSSITWRGLVRGGGWTKAGYTQLLSSIVSGGTNVTVAATGSGSAAGGLAITECPSGTAQTYNGFIAYPDA